MELGRKWDAAGVSRPKANNSERAETIKVELASDSFGFKYIIGVLIFISFVILLTVALLPLG